MAVTVEPADALPEYQRRYGNAHNDLLIAHVAIAKLEQKVADLEAQLASRNATQHEVGVGDESRGGGVG